MVGLSIILETNNQKRIINKSSLIKSPIASASGFLDYCSLCRRKLLPSKDIYMYKGDRAFCSEECRCRQICKDEEDDVSSYLKEKCGFAALISPPTAASSAGATSSSGSRKGRNRGGATKESAY